MKHFYKIALLGSTLLFLVLMSCSKDESSPTPTAATPVPTGGGSGSLTINSTPQFKATIDGNAVSYISGANNFEEALGANTSVNLPLPTKAVYTTSIYSTVAAIGAGVNIGTLSYTGSSVASNSVFDAFITVGNHPYSIDATNGIHISTYNSNTGDYWSSSYGTGDQTGSTFNIIQVASTDVFSRHLVKFIATFSCKLYNMNTGVSIDLTNGTYVGYFENM